jgi:hypothetical protein
MTIVYIRNSEVYMQIGDTDKELGELMRDVQLGDFRVQLFYFGSHERTGYRFYDGERVIFQGKDYGSSRMDCIDSDNAVYGLLRFLSLRQGDVDSEYFDNYTEEQLNWVNERAEDLQNVLMDLEDEDGNFVAELRDSPTKSA